MHDGRATGPTADDSQPEGDALPPFGTRAPFRTGSLLLVVDQRLFQIQDETMNTKETIRSTMDMSLFVLSQYVSDLDDADLMRRPSEGCNHLAWQLGHLISSEAYLVNAVCSGKGAELPAGFSEAHSKDATGVDDPTKFRTKQEYLDLFQKVRAATLSALEELPDDALDAPSPEAFRKRFPTVGSLFLLVGAHPLMHAGQFVVVRRQLGKPILI